MTQVFCDGLGCRDSVSKEDRRKHDWTFVLVTSLDDENNDVERKFLCRICSRKHNHFFKS